MAASVAILCMKWGRGFSADYVNVLYAGVRRHCGRPFRFYCFTDDARGLHRDIVVRPIPDLGLPHECWRSGCWPKLGVFERGLFPEPIALYLDLDVIVLGPIDRFIDRIEAGRGLQVLREWNPALWSVVPSAFRPDRGVQGSMIGWRVDDGHAVLDRFLSDPGAAFRLADDDQQWLTRAWSDRSYWPVSWTASFKRSCLWYYPLNQVFPPALPPREASIVIFHGKPRPHELVAPGVRWGTKRKFGSRPVAWVQAYWQRGLRETSHVPHVAADATPA